MHTIVKVATTLLRLRGVLNTFQDSKLLSKSFDNFGSKLWTHARFISNLLINSQPLNSKKGPPRRAGFTLSLITRGRGPPRSGFFLNGGYPYTDPQQCRCCGLVGPLELHTQRVRLYVMLCIADQRASVFFESAPPSLVHAITHAVSFKAYEALILSKRCSMWPWPSALPVLRACWCPTATCATAVRRVVDC